MCTPESCDNRQPRSLQHVTVRTKLGRHFHQYKESSDFDVDMSFKISCQPLEAVTTCMPSGCKQQYH